MDWERRLWSCSPRRPPGLGARDAGDRRKWEGIHVAGQRAATHAVCKHEGDGNCECPLDWLLKAEDEALWLGVNRVASQSANRELQAIQEIRDAISSNEDIISTDPDDLHAHGYSEWSTVNTESLPVAVAYPRSTEDVSIIAQICYKYHVPIIPYSGGTSLEG